MNTMPRIAPLVKGFLVLLALLATVAVLAQGDANADRINALQKMQVDLDAQALATKQQLQQALVEQYRAKKTAAPVALTDMQFSIPRLKAPPTIDGAIDEQEWAGAVAVPVSGYGSLIERPNSVFYLGWDPDFLYVAQRYPFLPNEKPARLNREPKRDNVGYGETCVEFFVDRKSSGSHTSRCRYQFMGNASGNRWEREDQFEIGQNWVGWDGEWQYKQRITADGKYWEVEMAIPRKTLYQADPIKDGDVWWLGMATDPMYNFPWSGWYGWNIPATFRSDMPEIRLAHPERTITHGKRLAFDMGITNTTTQPFTATVVGRLTTPGAKPEDVPLVFKTLQVTLAPGQHQDLHVDELADKLKDLTPYTLSVIVLKEGKSIYTWSNGVQFNSPDNKAGLEYKPDPNPWRVWSAYAPLSNFVKVGVDKYDLPNRDEVKKATYRITAEGKDTVLSSGEITTFNYEVGEQKIPLPASMAPGKYDCTVTLLNDAGGELGTRKLSFERKDPKQFRWLKNRIGEEDVLLKPFEPLSMKDGVIHGYQKEITLAGTGLPATIKARETNLLSSPIYLRGQWRGEPFTVEGIKKSLHLDTASKTQVNYLARAAGGPLLVNTDYHLEYDGTAKITLHLKPAQKDTRVQLDALQLVIPFTKEASTYMMANGLDFRASNRVGKIPGEGKVGTVWSSRDVPYQKMTVGSFVPIVHVGNRSCGLTWFAGNDQGWWPSEKKPAIEMVRTDDGRIDLVCNFASEPVEFGDERVITFGLCTVPTRPGSDYKGACVVPGFGFEEETGKWDPTVSKERVYARQYPDNMKKWNEVNDVVTRLNDSIMPYTEQSPADYFTDDWNYLSAEWDGNPFCASVNDYRLYWTERWIKEGKLDGYYMDNVCARMNYNTHIGNAYELPDGRVQPGFDLWEERDYVKRLRTVFQKYRPAAMICIHNTEFQFAPILSFADYAMGGEMQTPWGGGPDWMDMWSRDYMDVQFNQYLWGYHLGHLYHVDDRTFVDDLGNQDPSAAAKAHRTIMASMLTHGMEHFGNMMPFYQTLKKLPGGLEFVPSWDARGLFKIADGDPDLDVSIYRNPGALLVIVANYAKTPKNAAVWLDFPKLINFPGLLERRINVDFEDWTHPGASSKDNDSANAIFGRVGWAREQQNTLRMANTMTIPVQARDFRAFLIMNVPVAQATGF